MATSGSVKLKGIEPMQKRLLALGKKMTRSVISKALSRADKPIIAASRAAVPRRTGLLKSSLGSKRKIFTSQASGYSVIGSRSSVQLPKQKPYKYAHLVESGTVRSRKHPFLKPAFDAGAAGAIKTIGSEIQAALKDA